MFQSTKCIRLYLLEGNKKLLEIFVYPWLMHFMDQNRISKTINWLFQMTQYNIFKMLRSNFLDISNYLFQNPFQITYISSFSLVYINLIRGYIWMWNNSKKKIFYLLVILRPVQAKSCYNTLKPCGKSNKVSHVQVFLISKCQLTLSILKEKKHPEINFQRFRTVFIGTFWWLVH